MSISSSHAQCFEIESILVDACGSPEGENEMVNFRIGSTDVNVNNLSANWSNNSFQGICQNSTTASKVASLNNTISGCGLLLEPTNGVLPAGEQIILITSTAFDVSANSFSNLNDTIYVIFQCAGNTSGHFANGAGTGFRTLSISFTSPACIDDVTYDKGPLDNNEGASVSFNPTGNPTYYNNGCQAPFTPSEINTINLSPLTICPGDNIDLSSSITGEIQSFFWIGNSGSFTNPNGNTTTYNSALTDTSSYYLYLGGITPCNDTIYDSLLVNLQTPSTVIISGPDIINLCPGESISLNATGSNSFLWSSGETTASISVNSAGIYYVSSSTNCSSNIDTVTVNILSQDFVPIVEADTIELCQGSALTLNAAGSANYIWNTGQTGSSISINSSGMYTVTSGDDCPGNKDSSIIVLINPPILSILEPDSLALCPGETLTLNASGSSPFIWSTGETTNTIQINSVGIFYATSFNSCFSISDTTIVSNAIPVNVAISEPNSIICHNEEIILHATGANSYSWSTGETSDSIVVNSTNTYTVIANDNCPSNTAQVQITVIPEKKIHIIEGNSIVLCPSKQVTLNASYATNYLWSSGDTSSSIVINTTGQYYVETTNGNCPSGFDTIQAISDTPPSAIIIGDSAICDDLELSLFAEGYGNFTWSNGDEGSSSQIETEGVITLTATNSCNQSISDSRKITKIDCSTTIYIPNSFTPNGDGQNDFFKVEGTNIQSINGKIFNRWGELLYQWNNSTAQWDGTYKGRKLSAGVYVYRIKVEFLNDNFKTYTNRLVILE